MASTKQTNQVPIENQLWKAADKPQKYIDARDSGEMVTRSLRELTENDIAWRKARPCRVRLKRGRCFEMALLHRKSLRRN